MQTHPNPLRERERKERPERVMGGGREKVSERESQTVRDRVAERERPRERKWKTLIKLGHMVTGVWCTQYFT